MDIGAYYNPIHLFTRTHCPETVTIIEPILEPLSVSLPCAPGTTNNGNINTTYHILPIPFRRYANNKNVYQRQIPSPDTIVCIGCDHHYGPSRRDIVESFARPFRLYVEFPASYPGTPFNKLCQTTPSTTLLYSKDHVLETTDTTFKKRSMRIVEFK